MSDMENSFLDKVKEWSVTLGIFVLFLALVILAICELLWPFLKGLAVVKWLFQ